MSYMGHGVGTTILPFYILYSAKIMIVKYNIVWYNIENIKGE